MDKLQLLRRHLSAWWGLPLLWGGILIPLFSSFSPFFPFGGTVCLLMLSVAVALALLMLYDAAALPGIFLGLLLYYRERLDIDSAFVISLWYLFSLALCWLGYRVQLHYWHTGARAIYRCWVFWLWCVFPCVLVLGLKLLVNFELLPEQIGVSASPSFNLPLLMNYQSVLLAAVAGSLPLYYVLRIVVTPSFIKALWRKIKRERAQNVTWLEMLLWLGVLSCFVRVLTYEYSDDNILLSNHPLSLLLPVMLYGAMRFGLIVVSMVWFVVLWSLLDHYPGLLYSSNYYQSLTFTLSLLTVFTISMILVGNIDSRQRALSQKARHLALVDPMTGLPNLRWLTRDLSQQGEVVLCFIRMTNLDILSRAYGLQLRIQFKQNLESVLKPLLGSGERLYQLPDYDLVLRLNTDGVSQRLVSIEKALYRFRLLWNGLPVHPHYGLGYCTLKTPVTHLNTLLGELSAVANESLSRGTPQNADLLHDQLQSHIQHTVALLQQVQSALDEDGFVLMVQPIVGFRGDHYYEVLVRLPTGQGELITPDHFLPVVNTFGLAYALDMWVLQKSLAFIDRHRQRLPSLRFAVNLCADTLCRPSLLNDVNELMLRYHIEPYQLTFEITETHFLQDSELAITNINQLREKGCQIAIDDFGTGYASYNRLKTFQADTLKIDGSFIGKITDKSIDYYIVESVCQIARMKNMAVVAECVETEEQRKLLKKLGVDYLQGYLLGRPSRMSEL